MYWLTGVSFVRLLSGEEHPFLLLEGVCLGLLVVVLFSTTGKGKEADSRAQLLLTIKLWPPVTIGP